MPPSGRRGRCSLQGLAALPDDAIYYSMKLKFTAHKPKPKPGAVAPLQEPAKAKDSKAGKDPAEEKRRPKELGGPSGPEPTRYGDWERKGICVDF